MSTIKAILNNELIVLNEVPKGAKIKASQVSIHDGVKYFNPDRAQISPDADEEQFKTAAARKKALAVNVFSKLKIRRAMRALGQEQVLDDLLAGNDEFARDWADSDEGIDLADDSVDTAVKAANIDVDTIKLAIAGITNT